MARGLRLLCCLLTLPGVQAQEPPPGPSTSVPGSGWPALWSGPSRAWQDLRLMGSAIRQRGGVDFYEIALYGNLEALRRCLEGQPVTEANVARAFRSGQVPHAYRARFIREVGGNARRRFMIEALNKVWRGGSLNEQDPELKPYLDFFSRTVLRGERSEIWVDAKGGLVLLGADNVPVRIRHDALEEALVASYFAEPPTDPSLRRELVREVPQLLAAGPKVMRR